VVTNREEFEKHQGALSGSMMNTAGLAIDQTVTQQKEDRKKREKEEFQQAALEAFEDAYNNFLDRLNRELTALDDALDHLHNEMNENRLLWEKNGNLLNEIDDLFTDFENGGQLNRKLAQSIFDTFGLPRNALKNLSDAQCITLMEQIRVQTLEANEGLDVQFGIFERDQGVIRDRQNVLTDAKTRLKDISADGTKSYDEKLTAVRALSKEVGANTLNEISTQVQEEETRQIIDGAYENNRNRFIESHDFKPVFN